MRRILRAAFASIWCLALSSPPIARADPTGLITEDATDELAESLGLSVCRVYASFDDPDDLLLSVGFAEVSTDDPAGFYQHPMGADTAPSSALCYLIPALCLDSFVTIGAEPGGVSDATMLDPSFNSCAFNCLPSPPCNPGVDAQPASCGELAGGWFNANPPNGQGQAGSDLVVLIAQFTVGQGYSVTGERVTFSNQGTPFTSAFECGPCTKDESCNDGLACTEDVCVDGECLNTAQDCSDSNPCTVDSCNLVTGQCTHSPVNCLDGNPCTTDTCNSAGGCVHTPNTNNCNDGNSCTIGDVCGAGVCIPGTFLNCDDGDGCTQDFCASNASCFHTPQTCPPGQVCTSGACGPCSADAQCVDANPCTANLCLEGVCTFPPLPEGTSCGSQDDTECDNPDSCNGSGSCVSNHEPAGVACGSGSDTECDSPDSCSSTGTCSANNGPNGTPCGDPTQTPCDYPDACYNGVCATNLVPNGSNAPSDGNLCTLDICLSGVASHPPSPAGYVCGSSANTACDDPDTCDGMGGCLTNNEPDNIICSEQNGCLAGLCQSGSCAGTPVADGTPCSDGLFCNGEDTCSGGVCNVHAGNPCVTGIPCICCSESLDACSNCPAGTACGSPFNSDCDNPDSCNGSGICQTNHEPNGTTATSDGNSCTNDICIGGVASHPPSIAGTACGSGSNTACDNPDTCDGLGGCQANNEPNGTPCPPDANPCTADHCAAGLCTHPPTNGAPCDDGNLCTEGDTCQGVCVPGTPVDCNDNNACIADSCNPATGCTHTPIDADDNDPCTADSCDPILGALHIPIDCDDNDPCTSDDCDAADGCVHSPECTDDADCPADELCEAGCCVGDVVEYALDITSGKCPNKLKVGSGGDLKVYIVGDLDADVALIDLDSIRLRLCGGSDSVSPDKPPRIKDKVTPLLTQCGDCNCHKKKKDTIDDVEIKFKKSQVSDLIDPSVPEGSLVDIEVYGTLQDGRPFAAHDCVLVDRPGSANN